MQYCSISIVNALEMLQSCTKPSIWTFPDQRSCLTWKCPLNSHSSIYAITSFEMVNSPYARNIPSTIQCDQLVWYKCQALYAITYTLEFADREKYCRWWVAACLELSHLLNQAVTHLKLTLCKQYHANWQKIIMLAPRQYRSLRYICTLHEIEHLTIIYTIWPFKCFKLSQHPCH